MGGKGGQGSMRAAALEIARELACEGGGQSRAAKRRRRVAEHAGRPVEDRLPPGGGTTAG